MRKQTLKSSAALIGVGHEIFTHRCACCGTWLSARTLLTPCLCFLPQHTATSLLKEERHQISQMAAALKHPNTREILSHDLHSS